MMGGPTDNNTTNRHPVQLLMSFLSGAATVWMLQYAYAQQQRRRGTKETSRSNGTRVG
jgi:hypothetical protein